MRKIQTHFKKILNYKQLPELLFFVGFVIRLLSLNGHKFWHDETVTYNYVRYPLHLLLEAAAIDNHPPLSYLFLKPFLLISHDPLILRLTSVVVGTVSLFLLFSLTRKLFNKETALISTLIMALSPLHIYYSTELRMYVLLVIETLGSVWFMIQYVHSKKRKWLLLYLLTTVLALYTHYYAVFFTISLGVGLFLYHKETVRSWIVTTLLAGVTLIPWLVYTLRFPKLPCWCTPVYAGFPAALASFSVGNVGRVDIYDIYSHVPFVALVFYTIVAAYFTIIYLLSLFKEKVDSFWFLQVLFFGTFLLAAIANQFQAMFSPRSFVLLSPFFYISISKYISDSIPRFKTFFIVTIVCGLVLALFLNSLFSR